MGQIGLCKQCVECASTLFDIHTAIVQTYQQVVKWITVFTLSIRTPQRLTIYVLKFEPVQFTTRCCV